MTHMLIRALVKRKPPTSSRPLPPVCCRMLSAMRWWRFQRCIANATTKPPRNRYRTLFAYGAAVSTMLTTSSSGKQAIGSSAVTAIGTASVAHQVAIQTATAAVAQPAAERPAGGSLRRISAASIGPVTRPIFWCVERPANFVSSFKLFLVPCWPNPAYILCTTGPPIQDVVAFRAYQLGTHGDGM